MREQPRRPDPSVKLAQLLEFLDVDPENLTLLTEATETSLSEGRPDLARAILEDCAARRPLTPALQYLTGVSAMQEQDYVTAAAIFEQLLDVMPGEAAVRFNLAWSLSTLKQYSGALALLDASTTGALPQAAMLQIQLLHETGEFDEAAELALGHMQRHPNHEGLMAAISVLAIDNDDIALARACAAKGGNHPDALTSRGTLALNDDDPTVALQAFDAALSRSSETPRAWVGKGLAELALGQTGDAAQHLRHGATMFGDHVGSWIAAGWAQILNSDAKGGKTSFLKALQLDDTVAETHGALAVIAVMEGRIDDARRGAEIALRLDASCFSAALAQSLLFAHAGDPQSAKATLDRTMNAPLDASGRTIMSVMSKLGLSR